MYTIDIWNQHADEVGVVKRETKAVEVRSEILIAFSTGEKQPSVIINFILPVLESWLCLLLFCFEYKLYRTNYKLYRIS